MESAGYKFGEFVRDVGGDVVAMGYAVHRGYLVLGIHIRYPGLHSWDCYWHCLRMVKAANSLCRATCR